jgi:hypothetical protein
MRYFDLPHCTSCWLPLLQPAPLASRNSGPGWEPVRGNGMSRCVVLELRKQLQELEQGA